MHAYIQNGAVVEYPITNLRQWLPNASLPVDLTNDEALPEGFVFVHSVAAPDFNPATQKLVGGQPVQANGRWQAGYDAVSMSPQEQAVAAQSKSQEVRADRNARLTACDWTQVADAPVDKAAWAAYRQALRDLTSQGGFPFSVQWPTQPE